MEEYNKACKERENKYNYCIIKYRELYLKKFSLYSRVNKNNEMVFETNYIFTSEYSQANKFKISDAHYIVLFLKEGTSLKYVY